jgi:hypothetical protein
MTILRGREHPGRKKPPKPDVPCVPCAQKREDVRQFSLNPPAGPTVRDDDVPVVAPGITEELGEAQIVLRGPGRGEHHVLNTSAGLIWASIDGRSSVAGIVDGLHAELGVDRAVLARDVRDTVTRLLAAGLVTLRTPR